MSKVNCPSEPWGMELVVQVSLGEHSPWPHPDRCPGWGGSLGLCSSPRPLHLPLLTASGSSQEAQGRLALGTPGPPGL